jgi:hypothetical protein
MSCLHEWVNVARIKESRIELSDLPPGAFFLISAILTRM